jgi:hypothetical protein
MYPEGEKREGMAPVVRFVRTGGDLNDRVTVTVDLPRFAVRALEHYAAVRNAGAGAADEEVTFNDVIEWFVISPLSVKDLPEIESVVPGFSHAFASWVFEANYQPGD